MHHQLQEKLTDEEIFSTIFQNVLHHGTNYIQLLQWEYLYNTEIEKMVKQRDKQLQEIDQKLEK